MSAIGPGPLGSEAAYIARRATEYLSAYARPALRREAERKGLSASGCNADIALRLAEHDLKSSR